MLATDPVYKHCFMQYGSHTNQHGLYIDKFKKGNIRNTAIYCCLPDSTVRRPPNDAKWWDEVAQRVPSLRGFVTPPQTKHVLDTIVHNNNNKKQKTQAPCTCPPPTTSTPSDDAGEKMSEVIRQQSFWDSPEARIYFRPCKDKDVLTAINRRMDILKKAFTTSDGYVHVIDEVHVDDKDDPPPQLVLSNYDIFHVRQKALYLSMFYDYCESEIPKKTLMDCCELTSRAMSQQGWPSRNKYTIYRWHKSFIQNELFPNPLTERSKKDILPSFLQNEDVAKAIRLFCRSNLAELSAELLQEYVNRKILPLLVHPPLDFEDATAQPPPAVSDEEKKEELGKYGLTSLSISTIYRWMRALGFKYETRKKYYFVDGHEKEGTIKYRTEYVREMLNLEQRMYRWIQLKQTEVAMYGEKHGLLTSTGYNYTCPLTGEPMVEFHVDACEEFHKLMKETMWGGNLSVRMEVGTQPVVLLGHDECIFKQYQFTNKSWVADNKARPIIPKDEGAGLMISAFQGREFGFGRPMSEEDFKRVNDKRKGESYLDEEAAKLKRGKKEKDALTSNPFLVEFEYGAQHQGYWTYEHFVLQCEDVADCISVLHPEVSVHLCVDHSCGHDRQRDDGLNATKMNKGYGGKQRVPHPSIIASEDYLGPYPATLKVGDTQQFEFSTSDNGPFWMSPAERTAKRADIKTGVVETKVLSVKQLMIAINKQMPSMQMKDLKNKPDDDIKTLATGLGIALSVTEEKVKSKGWVGEAKGLMQVLYERGWIDAQKKVNKHYTMAGSKDLFGNIIPGTNLKELMENAPDFLNEVTLLQEKLSTLGVTVHRSPKCHAELAGEGIEYSWGFCKNAYRRLPICEKRTKDKFKESVRKVLNRENITTERVRKFARRARAYICAYYRLHHGDSNNESKQGDRISPEVIEKLVRDFKTHRCALDFENKFIVKTE